MTWNEERERETGGKEGRKKEDQMKQKRPANRQSIDVAGNRLSNSSQQYTGLSGGFATRTPHPPSSLLSPSPPLAREKQRTKHGGRRRRKEMLQTNKGQWMEQMQEVAGEGWRQHKWSCQTETFMFDVRTERRRVSPPSFARQAASAAAEAVSDLRPHDSPSPFI